MAAFSSFGFDESTQELLRRGAELTEMLKQQQFRPLPSEVQVVVLFNGLKERISSKQIRFHEYQVIPNLIYGLRKSNTLTTQFKQPFNLTTFSLNFMSVTELLLQNSSDSAKNLKLETKKFNIENIIYSQSDYLCTYSNLLTKPQQTYINNLSFLLLRITLKYELVTQKANKNIDKIFNVLSTFNIGS